MKQTLLSFNGKVINICEVFFLQTMWKIEKWKGKLKQVLRPCVFYRSQVAATSRWRFASDSVCGCGWHFFLKTKMGYFCTYSLEGIFSLNYLSLFYILSHWKTFGKREGERRQLRFCAEACFSGSWLLSAAVGRPFPPDHGPIASSTWALTSAAHFRDPKHWFNLMGAVELMMWKEQVIGLGTSSKRGYIFFLSWGGIKTQWNYQKS